jgi:hypothetical protein
MTKVFVKKKIPHEKEHVIIQPDDKINVVIHQMITPNERRMLLFVTVPGSSINSYDSWFIFNLWKNKHLLLHVYRSFSTYMYMGKGLQRLFLVILICRCIDFVTIVVLGCNFFDNDAAMLVSG